MPEPAWIEKLAIARACTPSEYVQGMPPSVHRGLITTASAPRTARVQGASGSVMPPLASQAQAELLATCRGLPEMAPLNLNVLVIVTRLLMP